MGDTSLGSAVQSFAAQMAMFQAMLLAATAVHKAVRWTHSRNVMRQFAGVPGILAGSSLGVAIAVELAAGALLLVPACRTTGAVLAALIWTLYVALIVRAVVQGRRDVDCGCSFGPTSRPLGSFQITRNLALAALAVFIASVSVSVSVSASGGSVPAQGPFVLGGLALLALYGALDQVMALQPLRSGELI
ncbi:MAG TPA: MauE/DoxX family redox-associated membrane protein [Steroidobacteraceae bacterium]|nr:MauE/DoxX family redox-associated membrane protein [Steroidobacteraceae bacterium]